MLKQYGSVSRIVRQGLLFITAAACSAALFLLCYHTDNKYTVVTPQPQNGALTLTQQDLTDYPLMHLITGWEIYRGKLLTPEDFAQDPAGETPAGEAHTDLAPDEYIFIGQYGGFEGRRGDADTRSPHGSATYRLNISLPSEPRNYMLELPEIYSAYKLYINGELVGEMGDPAQESYRAWTGNSKVMVRCGGDMEIIFAVADYSSFYSGIVYPPAFGEPEAVEKVLSTRLASRVAAVTLALVFGLFYLALWLLLKKNKAAANMLPLLFVSLCVCFAVYISYPIVKTLWPGNMRWYFYERLAYIVMLLLVALIQSRVSGFPEIGTRIFTAISIFMCGFSLIAPFAMGNSLNFMLFYSDLTTAYTWVCCAYLLGTAAYGIYKGSHHSEPLLLAAVVFATALTTDRVLPLYEPIRYGWFSEISGAVFVISIGAVMASEIAGQIRMRFALEARVENMNQMMDIQRAQYSAMIEKDDELKRARHDFRHHIEVIRGLDINMKDKAYVDDLLGAMTAVTRERKVYCAHTAANAIAAHYLGIAEGEGIRVRTALDIPEDTGNVLAMDICILLGNALENALEACRRMEGGDRFIDAFARADAGALSVIISNSFDGRYALDNGAYLSRKGEGPAKDRARKDDTRNDARKDATPAPRKGVGVQSIEAICAKHHGIFKVEPTATTWKLSALMKMS